MKSIIALFLLALALVNCRNLQHRQGKWFGYTFTTTHVKTQHITSLVPSSCVQYAATLPPCRNVRLLSVPEGRFLFRNAVVENTTTTLQPEKKQEPIASSSAQSWGNYLLPPSVTVTDLKLQITRMYDPRTVLTYSISGCKPSRLPLDLPKCPEDGSISPTPSVASVITSTIFHNQTEKVNLDVGETSQHLGEDNNASATLALSSAPKKVVEKANKA